MIMSLLKQKKIKFKPGIKLNHNIYIYTPDFGHWNALRSYCLAVTQANYCREFRIPKCPIAKAIFLLN